MSSVAIERRRHRRVGLPVNVTIRRAEQPPSAPPVVGEAKDVSLAGVCAVVPASSSLPVGSAVTCTVEVHPEQQKRFPFVRLHGKGWVARVTPEEGGSGGGAKRVGVAIAFTSDVTALGAAQP